MFRKMCFAMMLLALALPAAAQEAPPVVYEIAFLPPEFALNVSHAPGSYGDFVADALHSGERVEITGPADDPHEDWIPISYRDGARGWVERRFVTGLVEPDEFCSDLRVPDLIVTLQEAVRNRDSAQLAEMVSPRGLYVAQHQDTSVFLTPDEVANFFEDTTPRTWGRFDVGMGEVITESLAGEVTDKLQRDLLPDNITITCNDNQDGLSLREYLYAVQIPGYEIRNFYAIKRPGTPGNELNWGTWGIVIEYWDDQSVIMALGYYVWRP